MAPVGGSFLADKHSTARMEEILEFRNGGYKPYSNSTQRGSIIKVLRFTGLEQSWKKSLHLTCSWGWIIRSALGLVKMYKNTRFYWTKQYSSLGNIKNRIATYTEDKKL